MPMIALKPAAGCRLVLPEGSLTLDELGIPPGADMPDEGAFVPLGVWTRKRLDEGDAVPVTQSAIDAAGKRRDAREAPLEKSRKSEGAQS